LNKAQHRCAHSEVIVAESQRKKMGFQPRGPIAVYLHGNGVNAQYAA